jgi:hypothetical protein
MHTHTHTHTFSLQAANNGNRDHADRLWMGLQDLNIVPNITTLNLLLR